MSIEIQNKTNSRNIQIDNSSLKTISSALIIFSLTLLCSCSERQVIRQITEDFNLIELSTNEMIENYDTCISLFSDKSIASDGNFRVHCEIDSGFLNTLREYGLTATQSIVEKNYIIKIDASTNYRIFFEKHKEEHIAGFSRIGLLYVDCIKNIPNVYSLTLTISDTLKRIDSKNLIIKTGEFAF
jgi:hypothetical protein